jgi:hypothetical protein
MTVRVSTGGAVRRALGRLDRRSRSRDTAPIVSPVAWSFRRWTVRGALLLLLLAMVSIAATQGCGSGSASQADGAIGADAAVDRADVAVPVVDCPALPCLGTAVGVIVPCKPDYTCSYQMVAATVTTRCFTNGITIKETLINGTTSNPGGQAIMAVKQDGAACYSLEMTYADATHTAATFVYKDGNGAPMVTLAADSSKTIAVTCPGGESVPVSPGESCDSALSYLGGFIPASSCIAGTAGACVF